MHYLSLPRRAPHPPEHPHGRRRSLVATGCASTPPISLPPPLRPMRTFTSRHMTSHSPPLSIPFEQQLVCRHGRSMPRTLASCNPPSLQAGARLQPLVGHRTWCKHLFVVSPSTHVSTCLAPRAERTSPLHLPLHANRRKSADTRLPSRAGQATHRLFPCAPLFCQAGDALSPRARQATRPHPAGLQ